MITIIMDYHDIVEKTGEKCIVVRDVDDYIKTRILLERLYTNSFKDEYMFIVKDNKFKNGYLDIEKLECHVKVEIVDIKSSLENRLGLDLHSVSNVDILGANIQEDIENFVNKYDKDLSFKENCIAYYFDIKDIKELHNQDSVVDFIIKNIPSIKKLKNENNNVLFWVQDEICKNNHIDEENMWLVAMFEPSVDIDDYMEPLLFNNIFINYRKSDKMTIMQFHDRYDINTELNSNQLLALIESYKDFWREIDARMSFKENQLSLFDGDNSIEYIIENSTGITFTEYKHILKSIFAIDGSDISLYVDDIITYSDALLNSFKILRNIDEDAKKDGEILMRLVDKLDKSNKLQWTFDNIDDWKSFYINDYMTIYDDLDDKDNVFRLLEEIDMHDKDREAIKRELNKKKAQINEAYEKFLIENYPAILHNSQTTANAMLKVFEYTKGEKIVVFVVDGMRWDLWKILKEVFSTYGYKQVNGDDDIAILSQIPSVTNVSRLALFAGNNYKNIVYNKQKGLYAFDYRDEYNHAKNHFKDRAISFTVGGARDFNAMIKEDSDIYIYVYSDADEISHGLKDLDKSIIRSVFELQIEKMLSSIEETIPQDVQIIVTTDHGTLDIAESTKISKRSIPTYFLDEKGISYSIHNRYVKLYKEQEIDINVYDELKEYFSKSDKWYVIDNTIMEEYGLPNVEGDNKILFYIILRHGYYINTGGGYGSNMHGGLSLGETIIPFATFERTDLKGWCRLVVDIEGEPVSGQTSKLTIKIYNPNKYAVEGLRMEMYPIYFSRYIDFIPAKQERRFTVNTVPNIVGEIDSTLDVKYKVHGKIQQEQHSVCLNVIESIKTRISKSVNKARSLDL